MTAGIGSPQPSRGRAVRENECMNGLMDRPQYPASKNSNLLSFSSSQVEALKKPPRSRLKVRAEKRRFSSDGLWQTTSIRFRKTQDTRIHFRRTSRRPLRPTRRTPLPLKDIETNQEAAVSYPLPFVLFLFLFVQRFFFFFFVLFCFFLIFTSGIVSHCLPPPPKQPTQ